MSHLSKPALWSLRLVAVYTNCTSLLRSALVKPAFPSTVALLSWVPKKQHNTVYVSGRWLPEDQRPTVARSQQTHTHARGRDCAADLKVRQQHHCHRRLDGLGGKLELLGVTKRTCCRPSRSQQQG